MFQYNTITVFCKHDKNQNVFRVTRKNECVMCVVCVVWTSDMFTLIVHFGAIFASFEL